MVLALLVVVGGAGMAGNAWLGSSKTASRTAATTPGARNDERRERLELLANALAKYTTETGNVALAIPAQQAEICIVTGARCKAAGLVDLTAVTSKGYIPALPSDPVGGHERYSTGYGIGRDGAGGAIRLTAPRAEDGAEISQNIQ